MTRTLGDSTAASTAAGASTVTEVLMGRADLSSALHGSTVASAAVLLRGVEVVAAAVVAVLHTVAGTERSNGRAEPSREARCWTEALGKVAEEGQAQLPRPTG